MKTLSPLVLFPIAASCFVTQQKPTFQHHRAISSPSSSVHDNVVGVAPLQMGLFDSFSNAFSNQEFSAPENVKATARHILLKNEDDVIVVMNELKSGSPFEQVARQYSACPSSAQGGSLGSFSPGTMVPEFDEVIFDSETELNTVVGPVLTDFGFHMIVVEKRVGV
jgi:peptidyl-prolyl cis-trans isomerase C